MNARLLWCCTVLALVAGCSGGGSPSQSPATTSPTNGPTPGAPTPTPTPTSPMSQPTPPEGGSTTPSPTASASATPAGSSLPGLNARLYFPNGTFYGETVAQLSSPREMVALPNGDLLVGTTVTATNGTSNVMLVPAADSTAKPGTPVVFATIGDREAQGIAFSQSASEIFVATTTGVWAIPYHTGDRQASAAATKIVAVRTGSVAPNSDGDIHTTTSVTVSGSSLYIGVGSSCNRCTETDPTRAVVLRTDLTGAGLTTVATRFRNAIALTTNPKTGTVWAGGAGQDCLEPSLAPQCPAQNDAYENGHPFEFIDPITTHAAPADYGWPVCEEDHTAYASPAPNCSTQIAPAVTAPAYSTIIGAAIYPSNETGTYAFPASYAGGMFMTFHGSWHETSNGVPIATPNLVFVPLSGDAPVTPMRWSAMNPASQWSAFVEGWQDPGGVRYGRPTGVTVGPLGSLFVADDMTGVVYRIRPGTAPAAARRRPGA